MGKKEIYTIELSQIKTYKLFMEIYISLNPMWSKTIKGHV